MTIYAEYLFLENMITGIVILMLTAKLNGIKIRKRWLFLGGSACGLFSFIISVDLSLFAALAIKLIFSGLIVLLIFRPKGRKQFYKSFLMFYLVSFALGGITIGLMYFTGAQGLANNSFIYLNHITYLNVLAGTVLTYIVISRVAQFIKDRIIATHHHADVSIFISGKEIYLKGIVDTGNFLKEPLSGMPVFILSSSAAKAFLPAEIIEDCNKFQKMEDETKDVYRTEFYTSGFIRGLRLIPFEGVGGTHGNLIGFKPDYVIIKEGTFEKKMEGVYLAINRENFRTVENEECSILLHRDILDKGIGCYG